MERKNSNKLFLIGLISIVIFSLIFMGFFNYYRFGGKTKEITTFPREDDHIWGDLSKAKIYIIEYSDFECPACRFLFYALKEFKNKYGENLAIIYRHFPLIEIHPYAMLAAQASEAAALQGKFWEYHDILFEKQEEWSKSKNPKELFKKFAKEINLDVKKFEVDLEKEELIKKILNQRDEAIKLDLRGTPSVFINGKLIFLRNLEDLEKEVQKYLSQ